MNPPYLTVTWHDPVTGRPGFLVIDRLMTGGHAVTATNLLHMISGVYTWAEGREIVERRVIGTSPYALTCTGCIVPSSSIARPHLRPPGYRRASR